MKDLERNKEIEGKFSQAEKLFQEHTLESIEAAISLFKEAVVLLERESERRIYIPRIKKYLEQIKGIIEDYSKTGENYKRMGWGSEGDSYYKIAERLAVSSKELETWISLLPPPKKEIISPKPRRKKAIPEPTPPGEEKPEKPTKAKKKRKSKHPGKKRFKKLIKKRQGKISEIAKDLKVSHTAVSQWIHQDPKLEELVEIERKGRAKWRKHPGKERLKELIEKHQANTTKIAKDLSVGQATVSRWINKDAELEKLAGVERKERTKPKVRPAKRDKPKKAKAKKKRKSKHPGKEKLKELIEEYQANIAKIAKDLHEPRSTVSRWINENIELKELLESKKRPRKPKKPKISEIKTIDELKNLMVSGTIKRIYWAHLSQELQKALVRELTREAKKRLSELRQEDYHNTPLAILNQQRLGGLYNHYRLKNKTGKLTCRFILEELGLIEKIASIKEVKTKDELRELLLKGVQIRRWHEIDLGVQRSLVKELAWKLGKRVEDLVKEDYAVPLLGLGNKTLFGFYQYYDGINKTTKRAASFILEELGLVEKTQELEEIKKPEELKKLLVSKAIINIHWEKTNKELQIALLRELAQAVKKEISQLIYQDFYLTSLDSLSGRRLKDMYRYYLRQNKTGKATTRYILEELGLVTTKAKALKDVRNTGELKELFDSGVISQVSWSQLPKQVQAMLVRELARTVKPEKRIEELTQNDYMKVSLSCLGGNTLGGLHLHYSKQNKTGRLTCRFILEKLGLVKITKDIEEIKTKEELKELLISGAIRRIDWGRLDKKIQVALIRELAQKAKKTSSKLAQQDYCGVPLPTLNGRKLGGLYGHYRKRNYTAKSTPYFILEELSLLKN